MSNIFNEEQVEMVVDILTQYAPEGWMSLNMHLATDESHTEVTAWAETESNPKHGFHLDAEDRSVLDELIDKVWENSGREWNTLDFSVTADGNFELEVQ